MKDLRFTGVIGSDQIDVTFRTDMISNSDGTFNITQVKTGEEFSTLDKADPIYQKYFGEDFKETNNDIGTFKQFAIDNGLDLRIVSDKVGEDDVFLVDDDSVSNSFF